MDDGFHPSKINALNLKHAPLSHSQAEMIRQMVSKPLGIHDLHSVATLQQLRNEYTALVTATAGHQNLHLSFGVQVSVLDEAEFVIVHCGDSSFEQLLSFSRDELEYNRRLARCNCNTSHRCTV